jgi:hypothetical protein
MPSARLEERVGAPAGSPSSGAPPPQRTPMVRVGVGARNRTVTVSAVGASYPPVGSFPRFPTRLLARWSNSRRCPEVRNRAKASGIQAHMPMRVQ